MTPAWRMSRRIATVLRCKLVEQRLRVLQIARIKPLGEPAVDRSKKLVSFLPPALIAPEPCHTHRGAEFPGFRLLLTRHRQRAFEIALRFGGIWLRRLESDFSRHT